jgi:hypothetical protein
MASCTYAPSVGTDLFYALKKDLGYKKAWEIIGIINNPKFMSDFGNTLTLDSEGMPTLSSLMDNKYIQGVIGVDNTAKVIQRQFPAVEDTFGNYKSLLNQAKEFNLGSEHKGNFVAVVKEINGKLQIRIVPKTDKSLKEFQDQYASTMLNESLARVLEPVGITYGMLNQAEQSAGRAGVVDFSLAKRMASDSISMIRVANNREGYSALSEEYAHLIVAAFRDSPLMQRLIAALARDEQAMREILGDEYMDTVDFQDGNMEFIAEEAVGQLLKEHFKQEIVGESSLIKRFRDHVRAKYAAMSEDVIAKAMVEAEGVLSQMAKDIMSGKTKVDVDAIKARDLQLNSLSERIDRNMEMLKHMRDTEIKRAKLRKFDDVTVELAKINVAMASDSIADQVQGILEYSKVAIGRLKSCQHLLTTIYDAETEQDIFDTLRYIKSTMDSYGKHIYNLNNMSNEESVLNQEQWEVDGFDPDGNPIYTPVDPAEASMISEPIAITNKEGYVELLEFQEILSSLNDIIKKLETEYDKVATEAFAGFLKPVLGEEVAFELGKNAGKSIRVTELLKRATSDISFMDRWLDSMARSNDVLLQAFDEVVKRRNEAAKDLAIKDIKNLQRIMLDAKALGINEFSWAYERYNDGSMTGDYISSVNKNQYERDLKEFNEYLDAKYGVRPTGEDKTKKKQEKEEWLKSHAVKARNKWFANPDIYSNEEYKKLSKDQKEILNRILEIKDSLDLILPENKAYKLKAVQMRRHGNMRLLDSFAHPTHIWTNIKDSFAEQLKDRKDDNLEFGDAGTRNSLTDFSGREFMTLPILYTNRLENANDLSTDLIGSMMAYAAMVRKYEQLESVVDALEVGADLVRSRDVEKTVGDSAVVETIKGKAGNVLNKVLENEGTNMQKKLDDFMASQVYNRHLKDSGHFNVFGQKLNKNKMTSALLKYSSMAQLGFNALANLANVTQGIAMQNIEAAAGEFFNAKELAMADAAYASMLMGYFMDIGSRTPTNKLYLFDEAIDFKGDFFKNMKQADMRSLTRRILGKHLGFIGQEAGDHWLYNRTAIAMAMRTKVIVPEKGEMSLWEAFTVEDFVEGDSRIKEGRIPKGTKYASNGQLVNMKTFGREVMEVNQDLFGIYNEEDMNAANRVIGGRLIMQYRKFMRPLWNKRFGSARKSLITGREYEGFYVTSGRIVKEMIAGERAFMDLKSGLTEHQQKNIKRTIFDLLQFLAIAGLANFIDLGDDDEAGYAAKLANYTCKRLKKELGMFVPSTIMPGEWIATLSSPMVSLSMLKDISQLGGSLLWPGDWVDEIQSGRYKGMSTLEKNLYKAPFSYLSYYRQWDKVYNRLDEMADFYTRSR